MPKEPTSGSAAPHGQDAAPKPAETIPPDTRGAAAQPESAQGHMVGERRKRFLVAPRQPLVQMGPLGVLPMAYQPLPLAAVEQALRANPEIEVVGTVGERRAATPAAAGMGASQAEGVLVARMTDRMAQELHMQGQGRVMVERDQHLQLFEPALRQPARVAAFAPAAGARLELRVLVLDQQREPVPDAEVCVFGSLLNASGTTGADGSASILMYGEDPHTIRGLYVKPKCDFWSFYQRDPDLSADERNVVTLRPLSDWRGLSGFPAQNMAGWGQRAMRMDQLPAHLRGRGVRIAVIDSGVATSCTNLRQIGEGIDLVGQDSDPPGWRLDPLGHGSHGAGVIGGADPTFGIRGFAPEAEIHVCKLFPGGQVSQLIEALEYCIEHQIDVVNLGLGSIEPSEALERQIQRAKRFGVACIAAAGNSGDAVQYPASSPHVLAVAAIGKAGEFPPDSYHSEAINGDVDAAGYFSARFSCHGPRVDVCAPGVAIVSSVPPNNFAAWDGTSAAAPHVTGLAALVLAHHPAFQGAGRAPNADRVQRLFQLIRMSARRVTLAGQARIGYGMPDALVALGWAVLPQERRAQPALQGMSGPAMPAPGGLGGAAAMMGMGAPGAEAGFAGLIGQQLIGGLSSIPGMPFGSGSLRNGW